jgi:CheY-like chemotaxis protein
MNGWEFLEELKKYPLLQSLKVVIVSSSPNAEDIKLSRSIEQVLDYVLKPMSMKYLSELFQKIGWKAVS